jgi:hypothetical protein
MACFLNDIKSPICNGIKNEIQTGAFKGFKFKLEKDASCLEH